MPGLACYSIVADCFVSFTDWNVDGIENGDSLLSKEASWECELERLRGTYDVKVGSGRSKIS